MVQLPSAGLLGLPDELLVEILELSRPDDYESLIMVCKRLYAAGNFQRIDHKICKTWVKESQTTQCSEYIENTVVRASLDFFKRLSECSPPLQQWVILYSKVLIFKEDILGFEDDTVAIRSIHDMTWLRSQILQIVDSLQFKYYLPHVLLREFIEGVSGSSVQSEVDGPRFPFYPIIISMLHPNLESLVLDDRRHRPTTSSTKLLLEIVAREMGRIHFQHLKRVCIYAQTRPRDRGLSELATLLLLPNLKVLKASGLTSYVDSSLHAKLYVWPFAEPPRAEIEELVLLDSLIDPDEFYKFLRPLTSLRSLVWDSDGKEQYQGPIFGDSDFSSEQSDNMDDDSVDDESVDDESVDNDSAVNDSAVNDGAVNDGVVNDGVESLRDVITHTITHVSGDQSVHDSDNAKETSKLHEVDITGLSDGRVSDCHRPISGSRDSSPAGSPNFRRKFDPPWGSEEFSSQENEEEEEALHNQELVNVVNIVAKDIGNEPLFQNPYWNDGTITGTMGMSNRRLSRLDNYRERYYSADEVPLPLPTHSDHDVEAGDTPFRVNNYLHHFENLYGDTINHLSLSFTGWNRKPIIPEHQQILSLAGFSNLSHLEIDLRLLRPSVRPYNTFKIGTCIDIKSYYPRSLTTILPNSIQVVWILVDHRCGYCHMHKLLRRIPAEKDRFPFLRKIIFRKPLHNPKVPPDFVRRQHLPNFVLESFLRLRDIRNELDKLGVEVMLHHFSSLDDGPKPIEEWNI